MQIYFLVMKKITSRGEIENEALYHYIIDGIDESTVNKTVLYGTKSAKKFKEKLKIYKKIKTKIPIFHKFTECSNK